MKIAILTLNPCMDRNVYLSRPLTPGDIHRVENVVENAAGKGLNQAIVLANLGTISDYYSFGSRDENHPMNRFLAEQKFRCHTTKTACGIRQNCKIIDADGVGTEINEAGGPVRADELAQILSDLDAFDGDVLSVCGSIPQPVEKGVYNQILSAAKSRGLVTVLDADGEALRRGLDAHPDYIKPNRRELAGLYGLREAELADEERVIDAAKRVLSQYGTTVLCTLDASGSIYVGADGIFRVGTADVPMRGFSGAGDTYLAAFLHAKYAQNRETANCLAFASRAAAAKIALGGSILPTAEQIEDVPPVRVEKI